jgi:hypothetical protein
MGYAETLRLTARFGCSGRTVSNCLSEPLSEKIKASYFLTRFSVPLIPNTQQDLRAVEAAINLRVTNDTSANNQIKEMARRSELYRIGLQLEYPRVRLL